MIPAMAVIFEEIVCIISGVAGTLGIRLWEKYGQMQGLVWVKWKLGLIFLVKIYKHVLERSRRHIVEFQLQPKKLNF